MQISISEFRSDATAADGYAWDTSYNNCIILWWHVFKNLYLLTPVPTE